MAEIVTCDVRDNLIGLLYEESFLQIVWGIEDVLYSRRTVTMI